ncbi:hypothetical protein VNI00_017610 [Paramarasmius palmivorus]|uniref:Uncharacterized protein n=1 Tax=Paramarasmius palmivorus TaxID=297713 RepID=A0AAW0B5K5_9AGAR
MGGIALYDGQTFCGYLWEEHGKVDDEYWDQVMAYSRKSLVGQNQVVRSILTSSRMFFLIQVLLAKHHINEEVLHQSSPEANELELESQHEEFIQSNEHLNETSDSSHLLKYFVRNGYITVTESEIQDNLNHADTIAKSFAIIQTLWFLAQVCARAFEGLAITELEIMTVGYAVLNFGTYFLWWNKPQGVKHPIRVYWRQQRPAVDSKPKKGWKAAFYGLARSLGVGIFVVLNYTHPFVNPMDVVEWVYLLITLPIWNTVALWDVCLSIMANVDDKNLAMRISSGLSRNSLPVYVVVYGVAAIFGTIHCIPWNFEFPVEYLQVVWRISAVGITIAPILMGFVHAYRSTMLESASEGLNRIMGAVGFALSFIYYTLRLVLIYLAFFTLQNLPPLASAYHTVQWTTFVPHIG